MRALIAGLGLAFAVATAAADTRVSHGLSLFGDLKYPPGFTQLDYVNADAPKGGEAVLYALGGFDSLNPFIVRGEAAAGAGSIYDSLMGRAPDEPNAAYGAIAKSVEVPDDLSWAAFELRPEARWHDGTPLTAEDVAFSLDLLKSKGAPMYRFYYANVARAVVEGPHRIRFEFSGPRNRELPQIVSEFPVLPKHWWQGRDFERATLEKPLGSGPYRIDAVDPPRSITLRRVPDYWGRDLPTQRGRNNFDALRYEYFRDAVVAQEAFKAHQYDLRSENVAKQWATAYDFPAVKAGLVIKEEIPHSNVSGMQGFAFNLRRPQFQDRRVRLAISQAFDFEWTNRNLFYGLYTRTDSYFANSEFAARALPDAEELALLEPFRDKLPPELFIEIYRPPMSDGSGQDRNNLRKARQLLADAGWTLKDGKLVGADGKPFEFEILVVQPEFERVVAPMQQPLQRLGITARLRVVDSAQYQNRLRAFDFDMVVASFPQSHSPGNEQRDFWSSAAAAREGSRNLIGIRDPVVDAMVDKVIGAASRHEVVAAVRALDRVLCWGYYMVPHYHVRAFRIAYWNRFGRPAQLPRYSYDFASWWIDPAKDAALKRGEGALKKD